MKRKLIEFSELISKTDEYVMRHTFSDRQDALDATLKQEEVDKILEAYRLAGFSVSFTYKKDLDKLDICK